MFEIDEHLLSQILAIGLIVLLIVVLIGYIITAIFSKIMFDIFGIKAGLAFIPYYNTYRIYKEYKGRVWKKNWGIAYLGNCLYNNFYDSYDSHRRIRIRID